MTTIEQAFTEQMIEVKTARQMVEIPAHVCGPLAYHWSFRSGRSALSWTITHTDSGLALLSDIWASQDTIRRMVALALDSGIDWSAPYEWLCSHQKEQCLAVKRQMLDLLAESAP